MAYPATQMMEIKLGVSSELQVAMTTIFVFKEGPLVPQGKRCEKRRRKNKQRGNWVQKRVYNLLKIY